MRASRRRIECGQRGENTKRAGTGITDVQTNRALALSLLVGSLHAAVLLGVAIALGYAIGPTEYTVVGLAWRYGGLVVLAALPVWLALRHHLLTPLVGLVLASSYVLGMELTPPGPTFHDVAEFERLAEPTGITVVENGLYIVRYMTNASVWTVGFLFAGVVEYTTRTMWEWLPPVPSPPLAGAMPATRRAASIVAAGGGLLHAVVMTWFAARLGVSVSGGLEVGLYLFGGVGMWLLAAIPLYLLVRHRLVLPASLLTIFVLLDVQAEFTASVEGPHALYFGGWFLVLGILLAGAGGEYGLRRLDLSQWVART